MLVNAYADGLAPYVGGDYGLATQIIKDAESKFRQMMIMYGAALMQDKVTARQALTQMMVDLAQGYLGDYFDLPSSEEMFSELDQGMVHAIDICETADCYANEIRETIKFVRWNLLLHNIWYF